VRTVSCGTVGYLVRVGLADHDRSRIFQLPRDRRAVVRDMPGPKSGAHRRTDAPGVDDVLYGDGYAVQRPPVASGQYLSFSQRCLLQRPLRRNGDEGVRLVYLDTP
jgi:hypothetical protein